MVRRGPCRRSPDRPTLGEHASSSTSTCTALPGRCWAPTRTSATARPSRHANTSAAASTAKRPAGSRAVLPRTGTGQGAPPCCAVRSRPPLQENGQLTNSLQPDAKLGGSAWLPLVRPGPGGHPGSSSGHCRALPSRRLRQAGSACRSTGWLLSGHLCHQRIRVDSRRPTRDASSQEDAMRIEPAALAKAIGALDAIDLDRGWSPACCSWPP